VPRPGSPDTEEVERLARDGLRCCLRTSRSWNDPGHMRARRDRSSPAGTVAGLTAAPHKPVSRGTDAFEGGTRAGGGAQLRPAADIAFLRVVVDHPWAVVGGYGWVRRALVGPEGQQVLPVAAIRHHDPVALEADVERLMVGDGLSPRLLPVPSQRHPEGEGVMQGLGRHGPSQRAWVLVPDRTGVRGTDRAGQRLPRPCQRSRADLAVLVWQEMSGRICPRVLTLG
jgi:hypothetical protein